MFNSNSSRLVSVGETMDIKSVNAESLPCCLTEYTYHDKSLKALEVDGYSTYLSKEKKHFN